MYNRVILYLHEFITNIFFKSKEYVYNYCNNEIRRPIPEAPAPGPIPALTSAPAPIALSNNDLFQKYIQTFMDKT